jgi:cell division protein FtsB
MMKKSRLNLFKVTSMSISVLGILMIIATIILFAYIGISSLTSSISSNVGSGSAYDQLSVLKNNYNSLEAQYNTLKISVDDSNNKDIKTAYSNAELELVKAKSAIADVDSALSSGKSNDEVQKRITAAQAQLDQARASLSSVRGMM